MSPRRIQRRRSRGWRMSPRAVYVGRPSAWGNPYRVAQADKSVWVVEHQGHVVKRFATGREARAYAVHRLATDIQTGRGPWTAEAVRERLAGLDLACWCPLDEPCHADLLLALANPGGTSRSTPVRVGRILPQRRGEPIEAWLRRLRQATAREVEQRRRLAGRVTTTTSKAEVPEQARRGTQ